jgi:hypothetical protein
MGGGRVMLWFFARTYFDPEFSRKNIFASIMEGKNIQMQDFHPKK